MADLPPAAVAYVEAVESLAGAPVAVVSVGPERTQTIMRGDLRSRSRGIA
jgi:adenylosuccinate synthase